MSNSESSSPNIPDFGPQLDSFAEMLEAKMAAYAQKLTEVTEQNNQHISKMIEERISESEQRLRAESIRASVDPDAARLIRVQELNKRYFTLSECLTLAQIMAEANQKGQVSPDDILNMVERAQPVPKFLPQGLQQ